MCGIKSRIQVTIPEGFRYKEVLRRGKPVHEKFDSFSIRHPSMPLEKRAKIFSPFDALKGFDEAISSKKAAHLIFTLLM